MDVVTQSSLKDTVIVILAVFSALAVVDKAIQIFKGWKKPQTDITTALANDKRRLDRHEEDIADIRSGMQVMCSGTKALLNHAIHNGNKDEMENAQRDIDKYLVNRR